MLELSTIDSNKYDVKSMALSLTTNRFDDGCDRQTTKRHDVSLVKTTRYHTKERKLE